MSSSATRKDVVLSVVGIALCALLLWMGFVSVRAIWHAIVDIKPELAVGIITGAATLLGATITVMLGRYYERKREIEAHFRTDKIRIYDEFLRELFTVFRSGEETDSKKLTEFLREWQRKLLLWGGAEVLRSYFDWMSRVKSGRHDAQMFFLMDSFFRALRKDIGQSSYGLPKGAFVHLVLRHADLFLAEAATNPNITIAELALLESERFGDTEP
jgi:hypothetical protein